MNGILGMSEILLNAELGQREPMFAETIHQSGNALLTVINDVLDFSKIEAGKVELDPVPFDLRGAVEDVATLLATAAHEKGIEIAVRCAPEVPLLVEGDAGRLRQIVTILTGNSVKFTPSGHVLIEVKLSAEGRNHISVADTGIGIPKGKLGLIFDDFSQAEKTTTRHYGGTGLGLAITQRLVDLMGGEIGVTSQFGEGSTFWIELPFSLADARTLPATQERPLAEGLVLLVDDVAVNLNILEEQCRGWGLRCRRVDGGRQAVRMLERAAADGTPYDAVLLDYHMPDMDGLAVAQHAARSKLLDPARIVVLSSVDNDNSVAAFRAPGASDYLVKPVRAKQLYNCLAAISAAEPEAEGASPPSLQATETPAASTPEPAAVNDHRLRIFVAEDNAVNRLVLQNLLDGDQYAASFAEDGAAAYDAYREEEFDVVLMDLSMPKMDGIEATKYIRAHESKKNAPRTPILCLTAHAMTGQRDRCLEAGMDDYLYKPNRSDAFHAMIGKWTQGGVTHCCDAASWSG